MCLAQGHITVTLMRLENVAPQSRVIFETFIWPFLWASFIGPWQIKDKSCIQTHLLNF